MRAIQQISKTVAEFYGMKEFQLHKKSRERSIVKPRQIAMALTREFTNMTFKEIGNFFQLDHASAVHSIKIVNSDIETNEIYRYEVATLKLKIRKLEFFKECRPCVAEFINGKEAS